MKKKIILFMFMTILLLTSCTLRSTEDGNIDEKKIVDDINQNDVIAEEVHSETSSKTITEIDTDTIIDEDKAKELNTIGYELYKSGEYEKALDYFSKSFKENNEYLFAHYNYACTLGVLMQQDYPLWYERRNDIYVH